MFSLVIEERYDNERTLKNDEYDVRDEIGRILAVLI